MAWLGGTDVNIIGPERQKIVATILYNYGWCKKEIQNKYSKLALCFISYN